MTEQDKVTVDDVIGIVKTEEQIDSVEEVRKLRGRGNETAKRFVNKGKHIFQYGEWWCSANGEHCADVIATAINELIEENEQLKEEVKSLREHFIYLIGTALEDKECRKIYTEGLLEIFDDCSNLDEAKNKIKEYLE